MLLFQLVRQGIFELVAFTSLRRLALLFGELKKALLNDVFVEGDNAGFPILHSPCFRRDTKRMRAIALNDIAAPHLRYLADASA